MKAKHLSILTNGRVITLDKKKTTAEAVLIAGNRIAAIGSDSQMRALAGGAEVIDLDGKVLFPGFIEPHSHVLGYGLVESRAAIFYNRNLAGTRSREEMLEIVAEEANLRSKGEWITGRGFALSYWEEPKLLTRDELDKVAPDNPVFLNDLGGHITMTNSFALEAAGYTKDTPDPPNGHLQRDESGELNGILNDQAQLHLYDKVPLPTPEQFLEAARVATNNMARMGITTVHHLRNMLPGGYQANQHLPFMELERRGELPVRVWLMCEAYRHIGLEGDYQHIEALADLGQKTGFGGKVKVGCIKVISDGWLDARTSANYEEYADTPGEKGYMWRPEGDYFELVRRAHENGLQLAIHCDGQRATDVILDAYEKVLDLLPAQGHRHRLEHVPLLSDAQMERIAKLGLSVCTVPSYRLTSWYKEMICRAYGDNKAKSLGLRYRSLMQAGVHVFGGSDCHPCQEDWLRPLGQIHLNSVEGPLNDDEKFSREEAVAMFTTSAAAGSFEEDMKGSIEVGKLADLVVLSDDPLEVPGDTLKSISVDMTMVDGEIVYRRQ